ncbi:HlyD family secretion protein [Roseateles saccharophilus]|uniref:HlyD family secretion protein n=1 Tax=Roseateles saccharophilus TaxID=304 RepID=A0A4R3VGC6_ROSSA|nr:HlyD family efflux transporter periplasmic adaptor subunit [Roseateles saccharophilus]MDG0831377.1 HlyD family efflux transporter periplasmic adaptor subunit [Roseateles saccharophilus]TCV04507.1 HlyD family secretion protein [Roseateles saccharophilus]
MRPALLLLTPLLLAACGDKPAPGWTGYAEAELVYIAPPVAGRLSELAVRSGEAVAAGQALFALDATPELAADAEAQARAQSARAQALDTDKGRRAPELAVTRAQLDQARAAERLAASDLARQQQLLTQGFVARARVDDATTTLAQARARVGELEAALQVAQLPARDDERSAARALAEAAQSGRAQTAWRVEQKRQNAPVAARVQDVFMRPGEWVAAGQPVLALLPPANRKARFYVPQSAVGGLRLDAAVSLHCDGCGAPIPARISFIANGPEYTPPVIYSNQQRDKLVFLVEARPVKTEDAERLHPGQPLDVTR